MLNETTKNLSVRRYYTKLEDKFIIDNFRNMQNKEIAKALDRKTIGIEHHISFLRKKGYIGFKNHNNSTLEEELLEAKGRRNKGYIAAIRNKIRLSKYINLQIGDEREKVDVVFKSFIYFTVQHKNYKESYNYTDVLMGKIKVAVV